MWVSMIGIAVPCAAACCGTAATAVAAATPHTKSLRVIIVIGSLSRRSPQGEGGAGYVRLDQVSTLNRPYRLEFKNLVNLERTNWPRMLKLDLESYDQVSTLGTCCAYAPHFNSFRPKSPRAGWAWRRTMNRRVWGWI